MVDTPLVKKLNLKEGNQLVTINAPEGYNVAELLPGVTVSTSADRGNFDSALLFVNNKSDLDALLQSAVNAMKQGGILWVAYPKGTSKVKTDLNRDKLWPLMQEHGWLGVRQVAIDDIWSAMRFKPMDA